MDKLTRSDVDRTLAEKGYVHPEKLSTANSPYMAYTEGDEPYKPTSGGGGYGTYDSYPEPEEEKTNGPTGNRPIGNRPIGNRPTGKAQKWIKKE